MDKAVIFDLDGTLVDSYEAHFHSFREVFKRDFGLDFTRDDFRLLFGKLASNIAREFIEGRGASTEDYEAVAQEKRRLFRKKYVREVRYFPGVEDVLRELKDCGLRLGIASNSKRGDIEAMMRVTGLEDFIEEYVGVDEVENAKPDPELFLECGKRLGVAPKECVGVDDSLSGIKASIDAGYGTIAVLTGGAEREEVEELQPDLVAKSLGDLSAGDFTGLL